MSNSKCLITPKIFFAIFLFFGFVNMLSAQDADFVATPSTVNVNPNDTFSVVIQVQINSGEIDAAEIHLDFDPSVVQINALTNVGAGQLGIPVLSNVFSDQVDNINGTIDLAYGNLFGANPTTSFDFIQIDLTAVAQGTTSLAYSNSLESKITSGGFNVLGNANDVSIAVALANEDPVASFFASPTSGTAELLVNVDAAASSDDGNIVSYDWNFGDSNSAAGITASNNYLNQGNYTITLTVTDDLGATNSTTQNIIVDEVVITNYTITASAGSNGTITPLTATIAAGSDQTFTITPDIGYEVEEVLIDGASVGVVETYDFINLQANASISVSFSEIPPFQLCIASGSTALSAFGRTFEQDDSSAGATAHPTRTNGKKYAGYSGPISGATPGSAEELLFQKEIYGGAGGTNPSFSYDIPVTDGFYQVDLYFAEVFHATTGKRIFDVSLEGNRILDEYEIVDPIKDGVSTFQTAITRTYYVNVQDGSLQVGIGSATIDNGKLSGLCITAVGSTNVHPIANIGALNFDALAVVAQPLNITDANNDQFTVSFSGMPASLTYDSASNQLEGTPTVAEAGTYTINAIISDGTSSPVTEEFELVINGPVGDEPPTIVAIPDVEISEGGTASVIIQVNDDIATDPTASIIIYDKSVPGGTNNPFTPATAITGYTFTDNGGGSFSLNWPTTSTDGRSYEARVTAADGVNPTVESSFAIDVAQNISEIIPARSFSAPLPWYTNAPQLPFTVIIENNAAQNLGYVDSGDFVEYLIEVPFAGTYDVEFFTGKGNPGPLTISISEENGSSFSSLGTVDANQSGWQTYVSGTTQVTFTNSGIQTLRLDFSGAGGVNIRDFNFTATSDFAPVIDAIANVEVDEGDTVTVPISITDDTVPAAVVSIEIFDKSEPGGTNNPFTPALAISGYTFTDDGGGNYSLDWNTATIDGRSYEARVTANDGVNTPVIETFTIDVAQDISGVILARTFTNPLPWYGNSPQPPFTVSIEADGNIGYVDPGEFTEYLIDVPLAGTYNLRVNASKGSNAGGNPATLTISEDNGGFSPIGTLSIANTGWSPFVTYNTSVAFSNSGVQKLRLDFGGSMNIDEFEFTEIANTIPVVTITAPTDNISVTRGADVTLMGTAIDTEDGDISGSLAWTSDDTQLSSTPANGIGASIIAQFVTTGAQTIRATVTDSQGETAFDEITVNVLGPQVDISSPADSDVIASTDVTIEWTGTDVLFGLTEHFHIFVNPPDINNIDIGTRISTASQIGQEFWDLTAIEGIQEGVNTIVIRVADQSHEEFTNPEAQDVVTFTVCTTDIASIAPQNPSDCSLNNGEIVIVAAGTNLEYSIDNGVTFTVSNSFANLAAGTYGIAVREAGTTNCTATDSIILTAPEAPSITEVASNDSTDCNSDNGTIVVTSTGTNLEYSIDNGATFVVSNSFADLAAGTYDIVVRETGTTSCIATISTVLEDPMDPMPIVSGPLTYLEGSGGVTLDAGSGWASYLWSPGGETTQTINATAGTYSVTVVNAVGCEGSSVGVIVTEDDDDIAPNAICQNIVVQLDGTGNASITAAQIDNGSNDASGIASLTISMETFTCANLGENSVLLTVTDTNGNVSGCSATVTVEDKVQPIITCPAGITMITSAPQVLLIDPATATDNCDIAIMPTFVRSDNAAFGLNDPFPIGQTFIQWTATDASGNMNICTQSVTLTMAQSMSNEIIAFSVPNQIGAEIIDSNSNTVDLTVAIGTDVSALLSTIQISSLASIAPNSGIVQDFSASVIYTVTAEDGTSQQWTVTVAIEEDTIAPSLISLNPLDDSTDIAEDVILTATFDEPVQFSSGGEITITDLTDAVTFGTVALNGPITFAGNTLSIDPMPLFEAGHEYSIEIPNTALEDLAGNPFAGIPANGWTFTTLEATTPPVIICPEDIVVDNDPGECGAIVNYDIPTTGGGLAARAIPTVAGEPVRTEGLPTGSFFPIGITTITYEVTDENGITASCSFDVTVNDVELPTIVCAVDITETAALGNNFFIVIYDALDFGDNCPNSTILQTAGLESGDAFPVGTTTNTFEVTDASGNSAICSFDVIIEQILPTVLSVTSFTLVNAITSQDLFTITDGMQINVNSLPTMRLDVRANTTSDVESVLFNLTGELTKTTTESIVPYALFQDLPIGDYIGANFVEGDYMLIGTPFSLNSLAGNQGTSLTVNFSLVEGNPVCANFAAEVATENDPTICNGTDGSISISTSNSTAPLSYVWNHNASLNSATALGLSEGSYTVTVTDANGCSETLSVTLSDPDAPTVTLSSFADVLDTASDFTLTGGSPLGGSYSGVGVSGVEFDPSIGAGTYAITYSYTDPNTGCDGSATSNIKVISTSVPTVLSVTSFTLVNAITSQDLFTITDGMQINVNSLPTMRLDVRANTTSDVESVLFNLTGELTKTTTESIVPYALFQDLPIGDYIGANFVEGDYMLIGTPFSLNSLAGNQGTALTVNFSLVEGNPVCANFAAEVATENDPTICNGTDGSISISTSNSTAPLSYVWNHNASLNSATALGLSEGSYTVTVTDANGCSETLSVTLSDPDAPTVTLSSFADVLDTASDFTLTGGSPLGGSYSGVGVSGVEFDPSIGAGTYAITYSYTDPNTGCDGSATSNIKVISTSVPTVLSVTSFTLVNAITSQDLFTITDGMQINVNSLPTMRLDVRANTTSDVESVLFNLTGELTKTTTESIVPYALFQDLPIGDYIGANFVEGDYMLIGTPFSLNSLAGNQGTALTVNFSLVEGNPVCANFVAEVATENDPTICNGTDGSISISTSNSTAPLSYVWNHNASLNSATALGLSEGSYTVTVTDANGCSETLSVTLSDPDAPTVTLSSFADVLDTASDFTLTGGSPLGGSYSGVGVSGVEFDPSIGAGTYAITYSYTDPNTGCDGSATSNIKVISTSVPTVLSVTSFTLVNAITSQDLFTITDGMQINVNSLPTMRLDVRANTTSDVESVLFNLTGELTKTTTESIVPYALFQDLPIGDYIGANFVEGDYMLIGTPFSLNSLAGNQGTALTVNFTFIQSTNLAKSTNNMKISPNPAIENVTASFDSPVELDRFFIYDVTGRLIKTVKADHTSNIGNTILKVNGLQAGTYFVRTRDMEGNNYQQQMVIKK